VIVLGRVEDDQPGYATFVTEHVTAVLCNGLGHYSAAVTALRRQAVDPSYRDGSPRPMAELIEAAARAGEPELGELALQRLVETTSAASTDWALGIEARSRALLGEGEAAEALYREAIERLSRISIRVQLARVHLLYGEWLRREGRRIDARDQLRTALEMFTVMGVEAFAGRAERELSATGERVHKHTVETRESSPLRRLRLRDLPATASRTWRSASGCSSARTRSRTTCARCSTSSASPHATNSGARCRRSQARRCSPSERIDPDNRMLAYADDNAPSRAPWPAPTSTSVPLPRGRRGATRRRRPTPGPRPRRRRDPRRPQCRRPDGPHRRLLPHTSVRRCQRQIPPNPAADRRPLRRATTNHRTPHLTRSEAAETLARIVGCRSRATRRAGSR
jgi:hypothetical protein